MTAVSIFYITGSFYMKKLGGEVYAEEMVCYIGYEKKSRPGTRGSGVPAD